MKKNMPHKILSVTVSALLLAMTVFCCCGIRDVWAGQMMMNQPAQSHQPSCHSVDQAPASKKSCDCVKNPVILNDSSANTGFSQLKFVSVLLTSAVFLVQYFFHQPDGLMIALGPPGDPAMPSFLNSYNLRI